MAKRGQVAAPFVAAAERTRAGKLRSYARRELAGLDAIWRREDKAAGRKPQQVVANKMAQGWTAADADFRPADGPRVATPPTTPPIPDLGVHTVWTGE